MAMNNSVVWEFGGILINVQKKVEKDNFEL